jgi:hypothetical protein
MALVGCIGDTFTSGPADDAGPEASPGCCPADGSSPGDDGGNDSGNSKPDGGMPDPDSGSADGGIDASDPDSGPDADAGCMPNCDGGSDADTGTDGGIESGSTDSGVDSGLDSGSTDSGVMDSGTDAPSDSGGDAADAGPCVDLTTTCAGDVPMICQAGVWVTNGGACDYACNAGACLCNDPYSTDGGTGRFKPVVGGALYDEVTGLTWYTTTAAATTYALNSTAVNDCKLYGARLPHLSELQAILAEQPTDTFCSPFNADSQFVTLFSMVAGWYWTDTPPLGHPLDQSAVCFHDGSVGDPDMGVPACTGSPPPIDKAYTLCVSP